MPFTVGSVFDGCETNVEDITLKLITLLRHVDKFHDWYLEWGNVRIV